MWPCELEMEGLRSPIGDSRGDRGLDMLTGVGIFELELTEDVRSCLIPGGRMDKVYGGGQLPIVYG